MKSEEFATNLKILEEDYLEKHPDKNGVWFFIDGVEKLIEEWKESRKGD